MMNQNDWIPVSERLPEEFENVLVFLKFENEALDKIVKEVSAGFLYYDSTIGGMWALDNGISCPYRLRTLEHGAVTHWMPLVFPEGE